MHTDISAIILAGGENKRFGGKFKPELMVHGEKILSRMTKILNNLFAEIIIVTNSPERLIEYNKYKIVSDIFVKSGPLGGLHAGMKASSKKAVFAFAGDMPFIDSRLITSQVEEYYMRSCDAFIPSVGNNIEPLHAIYKTALIGQLALLLSDKTDHSLRDFLALIHVENFSLQASGEITRCFTNINSQADLDYIV